MSFKISLALIIILKFNGESAAVSVALAVFAVDDVVNPWRFAGAPSNDHGPKTDGSGSCNEKL